MRALEHARADRIAIYNMASHFHGILSTRILSSVNLSFTIMLFNLLLGSAAVTTAASVPRNTPRLAATDEYIWQIAKWQAGESHGNPATPITGWYGTQSRFLSSHVDPPISELRN